MIEELRTLSSNALRAIGEALASGSLQAPPSALGLSKYVPPLIADSLAEAFARSSLTRDALALILRLLADERSRLERAFDFVELVWTGPEVVGAQTRDTSVVVQELFASARRSVLVSGYAVYQGRQLFKDLAARIDAIPSLSTRMFLNINRDPRDRRTDDELTREFAEWFRREQWPGSRLPAVYFDPRALEITAGPRSCLHAKCIVIDEEIAFVTSANFTEAAQLRNIEAGVVVRSVSFASALVSQFQALVDRGLLRRIAGFR